jgi:hypothetical protein
MLAQRLKCVVVGLLLGLAALSFMSAPAAAHGQHRDEHSAVTQTGRVRIDLSPRVVGEQASPKRIASSEMAPREASAPGSAVSSSQALGTHAGFTLSSAFNPSCGHADGCLCCGAVGACCGMSCCAMALPVSAPSFLHADRPIPAIRPSAFLQGTNAEALLRPPRAMA